MNILIVDDDLSILRLLRSYLEQAGYTVWQANDAKMTYDILYNNAVDLIVLDVMLPDEDGWHIMDKIRRDNRWRQLPIIMLTAKIENRDQIYSLQLGADDYITKPFDPHIVVARVQRMLKRFYPQQARSSLQIRDLHLHTETREVYRGDEKIDLTPTEFALLKTMMEHPDYVFSRSELISRSLGYEYESMERTLDSHIRNLRRKIDLDEQPYIQTVYGIGYCIKRDFA